MSGAGNTASGSTIYSENTTAGGPNDVTVANLRVQQDMRVDGNFEVGTFSIDDLTVNDDLNITDQLTVGGNTYAQYLETALDVNCHGDVLIDQTIVCAGLANLNGGIAVATDKFTVAAVTGNTIIKGTLQVDGGITGVAAGTVTGAVQYRGATGDFAADDEIVYTPATKRLRIGVDETPNAQIAPGELLLNSTGNLITTMNGGALDITLETPGSEAGVQIRPTYVNVIDAVTGNHGELFSNRMHISDISNTHIARVRLNGSTMEVGPSTATTLALQTDGTTRATVNASTGQVSITNGIASTTTTSGALIVTGTGGVGVAGRVNIGGSTQVLSTTDSTSTITGALYVAGGVGVAKKIWAANIETTGQVNVGGSLTWGSLMRPVATRLTAQTLSGASIEFTGIPSTVDTIEVYFYGLSSNVTNFYPKIEIGTANLAGYQTTNYAATAWRDGFNDDFTTHIPMFTNSALGAASDNFSGMLRIRYVYGSNPFGYFYAFDGSSRLNSSTIRGCCIVGSLFTASTLGANTFIDRIRISPSAGSFDGGTANVLYY